MREHTADEIAFYAATKTEHIGRTCRTYRIRVLDRTLILSLARRTLPLPSGEIETCELRISWPPDDAMGGVDYPLQQWRGEERSAMTANAWYCIMSDHLNSSPGIVWLAGGHEELGFYLTPAGKAFMKENAT